MQSASKRPETLQSHWSTENLSKLVDVEAQVSLVGIASYGLGHTFGITRDGRPEGVSPNSVIKGNLDTGTHIGLLQSSVLDHETAITFRDALRKGPFDWRVTAVFGNMVAAQGVAPGGFGNQSQPQAGVPYSSAPPTSYVQNASVRWQSKLWTYPVQFEAGRFPYRTSPLMLQRPDNTPYFSDQRWDSGDWSIDGAIIRAGDDKRGFRAFIGLPSDAHTVNGIPERPMYAGTPVGNLNLDDKYEANFVSTPGGQLMRIDRIVSADGTLPLLKTGSLKFGFLSLQANSGTPFATVGMQEMSTAYQGTVDRVTVVGASANASFKGIPLHFDYAKSTEFHGSQTVVNNANEAIDAGAAKSAGIFRVKLGYQSIGANFGAPGDWGRIGSWVNPTGISDLYFLPSVVVGGVELGVVTRYSSGKGQAPTFPQGTQLGQCDPPMPLKPSDHSNMVGLQLNVQLGTPSTQPGLLNSMLFGVENADWSIRPTAASATSSGNSGSFPQERWYYCGYSMTKGRTSFSLLYEISNYVNNGSVVFRPFANSSATSARGGIIATQLTTRF